VYNYDSDNSVDTVRMQGIRLAETQFRKEGSDLVMFGYAAGDSVRLSSFFSGKNHQVDNLVFDDRTLTAADFAPYANQANQTGTPFNWQMNVFRGNELNAWAMPGGKMAMYTGMVERLKLTDDEIAAVIGHEMTHALLEHGKKAIGGQVLTGLGGSILAGASGVDANIVGLGTDLLASKPFSRHQESEADAGGVRLMAQAGYNPEAAISVWEKMSKLEGSSSIAILSTHPTNQTRINAIRRMLPELMPIYQKNKR